VLYIVVKAAVEGVPTDVKVNKIKLERENEGSRMAL
jgi:hypothetical protein